MHVCAHNPPKHQALLIDELDHCYLVKRHHTNMMRKLGVTSVAELVQLAIEAGMPAAELPTQPADTQRLAREHLRAWVHSPCNRLAVPPASMIARIYDQFQHSVIANLLTFPSQPSKKVAG